MLNRVQLMGRLTRDPELRYTQSNLPVASFTLAVERDFKTQGGERETDFIDFVAWRSTAEFVSKYLAKGRMAIVDGKLQTRTWKDNDGKNRKVVEVLADSVYFGDSKRDGDGAAPARPPGAGGNTAAAQYAPDAGFVELGNDDSTLPF